MCKSKKNAEIHLVSIRFGRNRLEVFSKKDVFEILAKLTFDGVTS